MSEDLISARKFTNEFENEISMHVMRIDYSVTVQALSPTSKAQHIWTLIEAQNLRDMLNEVLS